MSERVITAAEGRVRQGYHLAATLRAVTLTQRDGQWTVTGRILDRNAFRLSQQPLAFTVTYHTGLWTWPIQELQIADGTLTARLGPLER